MNPKELTARSRTLGRAVEVAGDEQTLAGFLDLALDDMREWIAGRTEIPTAVFLALIDIVASNYLTPSSLANLRNYPARAPISW